MRLFTTSRTQTGFVLCAPLFANSALQHHLGAAMPAATGAMGTRCTTLCANDGTYFSISLDDKVRILRRDHSDRARMVLSGRMADVCAALERMSRAEAMARAH